MSLIAIHSRKTGDNIGYVKSANGLANLLLVLGLTLSEVYVVAGDALV